MGSHAHNILTPFIDLIRHGKAHHTPQQQTQPQQAQPATSQKTVQPPEPKQEPKQEPAPREAAELIVNEERQEKSKMPVYKGLEKFKLLDKMGECVFPPIFVIEIHLHSVELSPTYTRHST
jgi:hypothetical protein